MSKQTQYFWFRLFKTKGLGPKKLLRIHEILTNKNVLPEEILELDSKKEFLNIFESFSNDISNLLNKSDIYEIKSEFNELLNNFINIVYPGSDKLPNNYLNLVNQYGISPILFCSGNLSLLNSTGVSIVGSRDVSNSGIKLAEYLSTELSKIGINIISGYAKGVDSIAHNSALKAEGTTTMVLSYGILNFSLKKEFKDANTNRDVLVVSQFIPKDKWRARNAMERNKLVCALSNGVIVIHSGPEKDNDGKQSGTYNAGKTALKMGLPLFVVSPSELDNGISAKGNEQLIELGGIEITQDNAINEIASVVESIKSGMNQIRNFEQMKLFN